MGAAVDAAVELVAAGAGLEIGATALACTDGAADEGIGFLTTGFAVFADAGAAVPRYGTVEVGVDGFGLAAAGVDEERTTPFDCVSGRSPSFRWTLT